MQNIGHEHLSDTLVLSEIIHPKNSINVVINFFFFLAKKSDSIFGTKTFGKVVTSLVRDPNIFPFIPG